MGLDPSGLPELDNGAAVRAGAAGLTRSVGKVSARATQIQSAWSAIGSHYDAPEGGLVLSAMDKPVAAATTLVTKTGTAATALDAYGDRLDELNAQRAQLAADMTGFNAHREKVSHEANGFLGWRDWSGWEKQDLLNQEEGLNDRAAAFAAAVDEAQRACANAIFGGAQYQAADQTTVDDPNAYGLSSDGYEQLGLSGQNGWGAPAGWTDTSFLSAEYMLGRGAVRSVTGLWDMGQALTGFGAEEGETAAARSGLWQLAKDSFYTAPFAMSVGITSPQQFMESGQRLLGVGKAVLGIGTWSTSGWNTAGGFVPDVVLAVLTGGSAAAAKSGLRGAVRGALEGALTRLAPTTATRIGDLNTALRAGMRARYGTAMTGLRDLGYRGIDAFADVRRSVADVPVRAREWVDDLGRRLGPEPVPAGGPRAVPTATRVWEDAGVAQRSTRGGGGSEAGWPAHRPSGGPTPPRPGASPSTYAGDVSTGMRGAPPHTNGTARVDVGDGLMPRAHEPFGQSGELAPFTRYEVRGRGVFYTNEDGAVEFVEPMRRTFDKGEWMSTDLRHPLPNVTYKVDNYAYFHTDRLGRTDHVHVEDLQLRRDTKTSSAANRHVVDGEPDTDAGHLLAREFGGAREEINLVQMVRDLNRGWGGRNLVNGRSVRHVELRILETLKRKGPDDVIDFDLRVTYRAGRAYRFDYGPTLNGDPIGAATKTIFNQ